MKFRRINKAPSKFCHWALSPQNKVFKHARPLGTKPLYLTRVMPLSKMHYSFSYILLLHYHHHHHQAKKWIASLLMNMLVYYRQPGGPQKPKRPAYEGAKFDVDGYCLVHRKVRLCSVAEDGRYKGECPSVSYIYILALGILLELE